MPDFTYITAFTVGLLGGVHCVGMCGGIVGALGFAIQSPENQQKTPRNGLLSLLFAYNAGRILSYTLAGGLMGGLGWLVSVWTEIQMLQIFLQLLAALFMLLMGLYISGWWMGLNYVEKVGAHVWQHIQPIAQTLLPVKSVSGALMLGGLWGWLPCGLVYSVLVWSVATGDFIHGALLMLFFGLGTLPNLIAMGLFANQLKVLVQKQAIRNLAGIMVIGFAIWNLWLVISAGF